MTNKYLKKYMFWEALSGLTSLIYLTVFLIVVLTEVYWLLIFAMILLIIVPIAALKKLEYSYRIGIGKE